MDITKTNRLKKYIFLISILFLVTSLIHLVYIYLYNDAKFKPLGGGSISEGLIGNAPHLNPLKPLTGNNKYVASFLYRSLLRYNIEENKISSNIASCDIDNLLYIECYLKNNLKWSNGTDITTSDIIATYKVLQNTDVNPLIKSLLSETEIEEKNNIIIFNNKKEDINFLNVLFSPIVNKNILDNIGEEELYGNFPSINGIYSGRYTLNNVVPNNSIGTVEVILTKNKEYYQNKIYIEKIILKFFKDTSHFLKHKNSVNIFNDKNNILGDSIPRLESHKYTLPQHISLILNKDNIENKNLRNLLLNKISRENLLKILGKEFFKPVYNPYLTEEIIDKEAEDKDILKMFSHLGYHKKAELLNDFIKTSNKKIISDEVKIEKDDNIILEENSNTGSEIKLLTKEDILKDFGGKSKTITSPSFIDKYNFITKDNLLLGGKAPSNVTNIYINENKIPYNNINNTFNYKLSKASNTIILGENSYKIYFEINSEKVLQEEIFFIFNPDKAKLEREKDFFIENIVFEYNKKLEEGEKRKSEQKDVSIENIDQEKFNLINSLNDNLYYNSKLEPLTLNLVYIASEKNIETAANYIKSSLEQEGIKVEASPISIGELYKILNSKEDNNEKSGTGETENNINEEIDPRINYDMILVGINLGYFNFNIFPYFHSSQVTGGYNFSNFKKLNLDILLEELKGNYLEKKKILELEKKVLKILKDEQIIKTLYTPTISNLVDKNIKDYSIPESIPNKSIRSNAIYNSYVLEQKFINIENKSVIDFIKYLYKIMHE